MTDKKEYLIERIEKDKDIYRKNRDKLALGSCRLILGEIQRDPNKDISDENVTKILKALRKMTLKSPVGDPLLVSMIDNYVSPFVSDITVIRWIKSEFSYKNLMEMENKIYSVIGVTKKYFDKEDINAVSVRNFLDCVKREGEDFYNKADNPESHDINVNPDLFEDLLDDLTIKKRKAND